MLKEIVYILLYIMLLLSAVAVSSAYNETFIFETRVDISDSRVYMTINNITLEYNNSHIDANTTYYYNLSIGKEINGTTCQQYGNATLICSPIFNCSCPYYDFANISVNISETLSSKIDYFIYEKLVPKENELQMYQDKEQACKDRMRDLDIQSNISKIAELSAYREVDRSSSEIKTLQWLNIGMGILILLVLFIVMGGSMMPPFRRKLKEMKL